MKIIVKHMTGSKANQIEPFELPIKEIIIGREAGCQVVYDPVRDDQVSRRHVKITQLENNQFLLTDLFSSNGTLVNDQAVTAPISLQAGDIVQLGKSGPKFEFDLDPRPKTNIKATRLESSLSIPIPTREISADTSSQTKSTAKVADDTHQHQESTSSSPRVGRETVERLIKQTETGTRKKMINIGVGILTLVLGSSGYLYYQSNLDKKELESEISTTRSNQAAQIAKMRADAPVPASEISRHYGPATVFIEMSWKLKHVGSGKQIYHKVDCAKSDEKERCTLELPVYLKLSDGVIEPYLVDGDGIPVGGSGTGSGFVVDDKGFILTNRHVAVGWETSYNNLPLPGLLVCLDSSCKPRVIEKNDPAVSSLLNWVPSNTKTLGGKPLKGKYVEGEFDYLEVTFPKTVQRFRARLVRFSDTADAALIRVDALQSLPVVQIGSEDPVVAGDQVTILGYPGVSPDIVLAKNSQNNFAQQREIRSVPEPTVMTGNIGKVLNGHLNQMGNVYQLTVGATGDGNNGGPVFNEKGRVVGIFTSIKTDEQGNRSSFAIPIKHGLEIMGIQKVIQ